MNRNTLYFLALLFSIIYFASLTDYLPRQTSEEKEITIGAALCLSGECASWGENSLKGAQLAIEEINNSGGVLGHHLKLEVVDTAEDRGGVRAVAAVSHLLRSGKTKFLLGPTWSSAGQALAPILAKKKDILVASPSLGIASFNEASENIFNTWPHDAVATKALANYAINKGWTRAGVVSSQQPWEQQQGEIFRVEFSRLGGTIVSSVELLPNQQDQASKITTMIASKPEFVVLANFQTMDISARTFAKLGYQGPKLAVLMDEVRVANSKGALNGCVFAKYQEPSNKFVSKYSKRFGVDPGVASDTSYDTVKIYADAIKRAGTTEPKVVTRYVQNTNYRGASGRIEFDNAGGLIRTPVLYRVRGEETVPL